MNYKSLFLGFFLLIGVFASTEYALAIEIYYESYEEGAYIEKAVAPAGAPLIGTFQVPEARYIGSGDLIIGASAYCVNEPGPYVLSFLISSSTTSTLGSSIINLNSESDLTDVETFHVASSSVGTDIWLVPDHDYGVYFTGNLCNAIAYGNTTARVKSDSLSLIFYGFISWDGNYLDSFLETAGITRIISVIPENATTTATSTTFSFGSSIYVDNDDYDDDMYVRMRYVRSDDLQATGNPELYYTNIDFPILAYGFSNYSTTTSLTRSGEYKLYTEIRSPSFLSSILDLWGVGNLVQNAILVSTSTSFIAGERTELDQWIFDMASTSEAWLGSPGTLAESLEACNPISGWDTSKCIRGLFLPTDNQVQLFVSQLRDNVLEKAPLGYVTRLVTILAGDATSTIPVLSVEISSTTPFLTGVYGIDVASGLSTANDMIRNDFTSGNGIIDVEQDQNIWDIVMPYLTFLGYILLLIKMISDVIGIDLLSRGTGQIGRHTGGVTKDEYAYKEKLYQMSKRK